jgi:hypothetical protein
MWKKRRNDMKINEDRSDYDVDGSLEPFQSPSLILFQMRKKESTDNTKS